MVMWETTWSKAVRPRTVQVCGQQSNAPNDVCILIPGTYEYGICYGKRDFANVTKVRWREHAGSSGWALSNLVNPQRQRNLLSYGPRKRGDDRIQDGRSGSKAWDTVPSRSWQARKRIPRWSIQKWIQPCWHFDLSLVRPISESWPLGH